MAVTLEQRVAFIESVLLLEPPKSPCSSTVCQRRDSGSESVGCLEDGVCPVADNRVSVTVELVQQLMGKVHEMQTVLNLLARMGVFPASLFAEAKQVIREQGLRERLSELQDRRMTLVAAGLPADQLSPLVTMIADTEARLAAVQGGASS